MLTSFVSPLKAVGSSYHKGLSLEFAEIFVVEGLSAIRADNLVKSRSSDPWIL